MDRATYISLCQQTARLSTGPLNIAKNVPEHLRVTYNGRQYYPVAYTIRFDREGRPVHECELHALEANSVTVAPLGGIEPSQTA